jgi:hypothetical protein
MILSFGKFYAAKVATAFLRKQWENAKCPGSGEPATCATPGSDAAPQFTFASTDSASLEKQRLFRKHFSARPFAPINRAAAIA